MHCLKTETYILQESFRTSVARDFLCQHGGYVYECEYFSHYS